MPTKPTKCKQTAKSRGNRNKVADHEEGENLPTAVSSGAIGLYFDQRKCTQGNMRNKPGMIGVP